MWALRACLCWALLLSVAGEAGEATTPGPTAAEKLEMQRIDAVLREIDREETKKQVRRLEQLLLLFHAVLAATTIFAGLVYYYNPRYTALPEEEVQQEKPDFEFGLFDGLGNMRVCCFSIWCLPIRWADTASSPKIKFLGCLRGNQRYLVSFLAFVLLMNLARMGMFVSDDEYDWPDLVGLLSGSVLLVMQILLRQHVRRMYDMEHRTFCTCMCDGLAWLFCCFCAAMQEAMQVEYVVANPAPQQCLKEAFGKACNDESSSSDPEISAGEFCLGV